jgi:hypothetical protein
MEHQWNICNIYRLSDLSLSVAILLLLTVTCGKFLCVRRASIEVDSNLLNIELCQETLDLEPHHSRDDIALVYCDKTVLYLGIISPLLYKIPTSMLARLSAIKALS